MDAPLTRRSLIGAGLTVTLLPLAGCADVLGGYSLEQGVRRLLTVSAQRASARLLRENGFLEDELARVTLPAGLGGNGAASTVAPLLRDEAVQARLLAQVNKAAEVAAYAAMPLVMQSIQSFAIGDPEGVVEGGPTAATDLLKRTMGNALYDVAMPWLATTLRQHDAQVITQALAAAEDVSFEALHYDVARKASDGIYRAIGREEAAIRADPRATGDPVLIDVFGYLG